VLIVFRVAEIGKVLRFDEGIGRQLAGLTVGLELPIGLEVAAQEEELQQRVRQRARKMLSQMVRHAKCLRARSLPPITRILGSNWTSALAPIANV
jgi:hypothetical protein